MPTAIPFDFPVSVYIVTLNCGAWLADTLESVRDFPEVIILDSGSSDDTWEIASRYSNVRIRHQEWQGYAGQKALALAECSQPWVLNLDGDEVLSAALREEISTTTLANQVSGLIVPIRDAFMGEPAHPWGYCHAKVRCFRRDRGRYASDTQVHEGVLVDGVLRRARGCIEHFGETSVAIKVEKNNSYSTLKADEKLSNGKSFSTLKLVLIMPLAFIKSYVLRRDFLNGRRGFIGSMINAFYAFMKEAKLYEAVLQSASRAGKPKL